MEGNFTHFIAGGVGGTVGAVLTCPLEVIKVRLQSSCASFSAVPLNASQFQIISSTPLTHQSVRQTCTYTCTNPMVQHSPRVTILQALRYIIQTEGAGGLYRGILPTLVGVMPSRAIYFSAYHQGQLFYKDFFSNGQLIFFFSAGTAGFIAATLTNPIWFVKTRLQLDQQTGDKTLTAFRCVRNTFRKGGILGFYKGVQASYFGISETVLNFVLYETLKRHLLDRRDGTISSDKLAKHLQCSSDIIFAMMASGVSKFVATTTCYPHEVVRTRLRQEGNKYYGFVQTLRTVYTEEGFQALYRGLCSHYLRQIPNTCILIGTYELVVFLMNRYSHSV